MTPPQRFSIERLLEETGYSAWVPVADVIGTESDAAQSARDRAIRTGKEHRHVRVPTEGAR